MTDDSWPAEAKRIKENQQRMDLDTLRSGAHIISYDPCRCTWIRELINEGLIKAKEVEAVNAWTIGAKFIPE